MVCFAEFAIGELLPFSGFVQTTVRLQQGTRGCWPSASCSKFASVSFAINAAYMFGTVPSIRSLDIFVLRNLWLGSIKGNRTSLRL